MISDSMTAQKSFIHHFSKNFIFLYRGLPYQENLYTKTRF